MQCLAPTPTSVLIWDPLWQQVSPLPAFFLLWPEQSRPWPVPSQPLTCPHLACFLFPGSVGECPLSSWFFVVFWPLPNSPSMPPWPPVPTQDHLRVKNTCLRSLKVIAATLQIPLLYTTTLLLWHPLACHTCTYLTICPGLQCLKLCSSGSLSPASKFDTSSSLSQVSAMPAGDGAPLVHMCQYPCIWLPVLGHFSKPGVPKGFKEDRCVIGSDCTSTCPGLLHVHWVAWTVAQIRYLLYTEQRYLTPQHPQERHQCQCKHRPSCLWVRWWHIWWSRASLTVCVRPCQHWSIAQQQHHQLHHLYDIWLCTLPMPMWVMQLHSQQTGQVPCTSSLSESTRRLHQSNPYSQGGLWSIAQVSCVHVVYSQGRVPSSQIYHTVHARAHLICTIWWTHIHSIIHDMHLGPFKPSSGSDSRRTWTGLQQYYACCAHCCISILFPIA